MHQPKTLGILSVRNLQWRIIWCNLYSFKAHLKKKIEVCENDDCVEPRTLKLLIDPRPAPFSQEIIWENNIPWCWSSHIGRLLYTKTALYLAARLRSCYNWWNMARETKWQHVSRQEHFHSQTGCTITFGFWAIEFVMGVAQTAGGWQSTQWCNLLHHVIIVSPSDVIVELWHVRKKKKKN